MKIELQKDPVQLSIWNIYMDGKLWRPVHGSIFGSSPSFSSFFQNGGEWDEHFFDRERRCVFVFVLKRLGAKALHSIELQRLLRDRLVSPQTIDWVIHECMRLGYVNDPDWIENFLRYQVQKHQSRQQIAQRLCRKGFLIKEAQEIAARVNRDIDSEQIRYLLQTRYRNRNLKEMKERKKVIASLARKGFPLSLIIDLTSKSNIE